MYLRYYGFREEPFGSTPDPRFLFASASHREAMASLQYSTETGRGFFALIAPPGMGKTTLLFQALENYQDSARTAFLFNTQCNSREFLRFLLSEVGIEDETDDVVRLHRRFNEFLVANSRLGRRFILIVDEAQNLSSEVLETVRLLSDFETSRAKLMHIILAGQPELYATLKRPNLSQLLQRISMISRIEPLSAIETADYINHRLTLAGYHGEPIFSDAAVTMIAHYSRGIPRLINNICFSALSLGYASETKQIDAELITEAIADLPCVHSYPAQRTNPVVKQKRVPGPEPKRSAPPVASRTVAAPLSAIPQSDMPSAATQSVELPATMPSAVSDLEMPSVEPQSDVLSAVSHSEMASVVPPPATMPSVEPPAFANAFAPSSVEPTAAVPTVAVPSTASLPRPIQANAPAKPITTGTPVSLAATAPSQIEPSPSASKPAPEAARAQAAVRSSVPPHAPAVAKPTPVRAPSRIHERERRVASAPDPIPSVTASYGRHGRRGTAIGRVALAVLLLIGCAAAGYYVVRPLVGTSAAGSTRGVIAAPPLSGTATESSPNSPPTAIPAQTLTTNRDEAQPSSPYRTAGGSDTNDLRATPALSAQLQNARSETSSSAQVADTSGSTPARIQSMNKRTAHLASNRMPVSERSTGSEAVIVLPQLIERVHPDYPLAASRTNAEGEVVLTASVNERGGYPQNLKFLEGNQIFKQAALRAVSQWKYRPGTYNGRPAGMPVKIRLKFSPSE